MLAFEICCRAARERSADPLGLAQGKASRLGLWHKKALEAEYPLAYIMIARRLISMRLFISYIFLILCTIRRTFHFFVDEKQ